jgi:hypothetical protein
MFPQTRTTSLPQDLSRGVRLNRDVFLMVEEGVGRILDFERGEFFGLDEVGTRMLSIALERGAQYATAKVAAEYGVDERDVRSDLTDLVRDLLIRQIVIPHENDADAKSALRLAARCWRRAVSRLLFDALRRVAAKAWHVAEAHRSPSRRHISRLCTLTWLSLRFLGWRGTLDLFRTTHAKPMNLPPEIEQQIIDETDRLVRETAARRLLLPMVCKERAVAAWQILRGWYGLPATVVVGYERYPFGAHAWVTCHGQIVTDDPEHCQIFEPVAQYS